MYVCMYVYIYTFVCIYIYIYMYMITHIYIIIHVYIHLHVYIYVYIYVYKFICIDRDTVHNKTTCASQGSSVTLLTQNLNRFGNIQQMYKRDSLDNADVGDANQLRQSDKQTDRYTHT